MRVYGYARNDTDPFPNTLEDNGVPVYPWTKSTRQLRCHIDFDRSDSEEVSGLHNMFHCMNN